MTQAARPVENDALTIVSAGSNVTSNWGDPKETILKCNSALSERLHAKVVSSRLYVTPAFPDESDPEFVNAAFLLKSALPAVKILEVLHQIEVVADRERKERWSARTLDLDLIGYGDEVAPNKEAWQHWHDLAIEEQASKAPDQLILPHPRVQDRAFALVPLADVAPDWVHPVLGKDIRTLLAERPQAEIDTVRVIKAA